MAPTGKCLYFTMRSSTWGVRLKGRDSGVSGLGRLQWMDGGDAKGNARWAKPVLDRHGRDSCGVAILIPKYGVCGGLQVQRVAEDSRRLS